MRHFRVAAQSPEENDKLIEALKNGYPYSYTPLVIGWCLDLLFGDPACLPHPIIWFGRMIGFANDAFNGGEHRVLKGGLVAVVLILMAFILTWILMDLVSVSVWLSVAVQSVLIFYCLAGTTLVKEVGMVFKAVDRSLEEGRMQVRQNRRT